MLGHDVIVIGGSAGGIEALKVILGGLPADLPAAVVTVLHLTPGSRSVLPSILSRAGPLRAQHVEGRAPIEHGRVYVAAPDHHLLVRRGYIESSNGPRENRSRPAIDPTFRTAARAYGPRVVGVILTGSLDDGTHGLWMVKAFGGIAVVQDPADALFSAMPESAIEYVSVDHVVPLEGIAPLLVRLAGTPAGPESPEEPMDGEDAESPSSYTCPECHGALFEVRDGELVRFRCRVGHRFSPESLLTEQSEATEAALWAALRALEESASMARRMQNVNPSRGITQLTQRLGQTADEREQQAALLRKLLAGLSRPEPSNDPT